MGMLSKNNSSSPLLGTSILKPTSQKKKKNLAAALTLTSLIDAFTVIVIYLLVAGQGNPSQLQLTADERALPVATQAQSLDAGTVIRIEKGKYFVEGKETALSQVAESLRQIRTKFVPSTVEPHASLVIQADKKIDFSQLSPLIRAGSISGFNQFKFAVTQGEG